MTRATTTAADLLAFEEIAPRRYRSTHILDNLVGFVFGGQAIGQSLAAAGRTAPGLAAQSCACYFIERGAMDHPIDYDVDLTRDGGNLALRRVRAGQAGRAIFEMSCAFARRPPGAWESGRLRDAPDPEALPTLDEFAARNAHRLSPEALGRYRRAFPIEMRLVDPEEALFGELPSERRDFFLRMPTAAAIDDAQSHQSLIAFMSDYWFTSVAAASLRPSPDAKRSALYTVNHGLWFHAPARADEQLFFRTSAVWTAQSRGLVRGSLYARDGRLVATAMQDVAIRAMK